MRRISHATQATDLFGAGKHGFTEGEFATQTPPTQVTVDIMNDVQEEIARAIEAANLPLDATYRLTAAIQQLVADNQPRNVITPSAILSAQTAYNPTGWATAFVVRLSGSGTFLIHGMAPGTQKLLVNCNAVGGASLSLVHESLTDTDVNRIITPTEGNFSIAPGESLLVQYDATTQRWRPVVTPKPRKTYTRRFAASRGAALKDLENWVPSTGDAKTGTRQYEGTSGTWGLDLSSIPDMPPGSIISEIKVFYDRSSGTCELKFWKIDHRGDFDSPQETDTAMSGSGTDLSTTMTVSPAVSIDTEDFYYFVVVDVTTATDLVVHGFEITWSAL